MEDTTPDFQDLLAAFDIPDMRVKISEVRSLAPCATSKPALASGSVSLSSPKTTATVKQEPVPVDDSEGTSWQQDGQAEGVVQPSEGLKALQMVASQLEGTADSDVPQASATAAVTQASSVKTLLNGSATTNGDGTSSFFQPVREAPLSSAQHAKVVSSTLMANSWINAKSLSSTTAVSVAPKPVRPDKPAAVPTALIRYSKPVSSPTNVLAPPNFITTAVSASVRVTLVNSNVTSMAPPLLVGSRAPLPAKSKIVSIPVDLSDGKIPKHKNASQSSGTANTSAGYPVLRLSSSDLLKRSNPIPKKIPPNQSQLSRVIDGGFGKIFKMRYACEECGDTFLVKNSLKMHMERRSVEIAFMCDFCYSRNCLMFYNKCSYYAHLRHHSQQMKLRINYGVQANNATISSLTYTKPTQPVDIIVMTDVVKVGPKNGPTKSIEEGQSVDQPNSSANEFSVIKSPPNTSDASKSVLIYKSGSNGFDCHLCGANLSTEYALQTHLHRYVSMQEMTCDVCLVALPNKCQLRAHSLMHKGMWSCPECGKRFGTMKSFFNHISINCMHWYRQVRTRCKLCSKLVADYEQHLDKGHEMLFYRCVSCSMAFKTLPALKEHSERKHKVQPGSPLCRIISKCPFCETVFMQKPLLQAHIKMHIEKDTKNKVWVYCCPKCTSKIGINLENFKKHMILSHPTLKHFHCDYCRQNFKSYDDLCTHFHTGKLVDHQEGSVEKICKVKKLRPLKMSDKKGNENQSTETKSVNTPEKSNDAKPEEQPLSKLYVKKTRSCPGCRKNGKNLFFFREEDLRVHMFKVHPEMELSSLNSDECVKYVTVKPKDNEPQHDGKKTDDAPEDSKKRKSSVADEKPARKKPKFALPTEFTCAKAQCHYQTSNRAEFKAHIQSHVSDRSLSQCDECGMCFRIGSALRRHLFIQHSIRDFDTYMGLLQGTTPPSTPEQRASPSPVQEPKPHESPSTSSPVVIDKANLLECKVCYKTFQNEGTLRTHMRNHGMAFIRSKRSLSNDSDP